MSDNIYTFNNQDYDFTVRFYNGINDVYLNNTAWNDLIIEEDIFDWKVKGSITINTPYDSFERESKEASTATHAKKEQLVYKFRNDGRDTLFISIKPKIDNSNIFTDKKWRLEIETVIYDVQDLPHETITQKSKKIYFWEKAYQMMTEKNSDFSTAIAGSNTGNTNSDQTDNGARSLKTGEAIMELFKGDDDFKKFVSSSTDWDNGSEKNKIQFSTPNGFKFLNSLEYLLNYHISDEAHNNQPCIFKFERAEATMKPKQFSLMPISSYFEKAGKEQNSPKEYQTEHFFLREFSDEDASPALLKAPLSNDSSTEIKADEHNIIRDYRLVDMSGSSYARNLVNYRTVAFNTTQGQFNEEGKKHVPDEYKKFFKESIQNNILTDNTSDRLPVTPFIGTGTNTQSVYSLREYDIARYSEGRNKMIKHYLFSNLAITFATRGLTVRQPGRFFGLSKQNSNDKEFDHKLEGQYFVTNVIHCFNNTERTYFTEMIGVKTHTYKEITTFTPDDVLIIK
jgi:hypothetical protein